MEFPVSETANRWQDRGVGRPAVLVVDDNDLVLKVVTQFLSARGVYVMTTTQPAIGKDLADGVENLVAVVLDVDMPKVDGGALSEVLRANSIHEKVPIIFYSGLRKVRTDALVAKVPLATVVSKTDGVDALWQEIQRVAPQILEQVDSSTGSPQSVASQQGGSDEFELDEIFDGLVERPSDPGARSTVRPQNPAAGVVFEERREVERQDDVHTRATVRPPKEDEGT